MLRVPEHEVVDAVRQAAGAREGAAASGRSARPDREQAEALAGAARRRSAASACVTEAVEAADPKALLELSDQVRQKLGDAAVVLGAAADGRVHLVANFAPAVVERGLKAGRRRPRRRGGRRRRGRRPRHAGAGRRQATPRSSRRRSRPRARRDRDARSA